MTHQSEQQLEKISKNLSINNLNLWMKTNPE